MKAIETKKNTNNMDQTTLDLDKSISLDKNKTNLPFTGGLAHLNDNLLGKKKILNFKEALLLKIKSYDQFYKKVSEKLKAQINFDPRIFENRLSCASERPPNLTIHYYIRACAILVKLIESPKGIKKLRKIYARKKNTGVKRPKIKLATYFGLKKLLEPLIKKGYLGKTDKGYYTTETGKEILMKTADENSK